jgi:hypothetical protein
MNPGIFPLKGKIMHLVNTVCSYPNRAVQLRGNATAALGFVRSTMGHIPAKNSLCSINDQTSHVISNAR